MILAIAGCSLILLAEVSKVDAFWSHMSASGKFMIGKVRFLESEVLTVRP